MKQLIRIMIEFGNKVIQSIQYGSHTISEIRFGNHKIYPDEPTPPTPVVTSYTLTNILVHISSGYELKVDASNTAYITASLNELHDGKIYKTTTETAYTINSQYRMVTVGSGRLRYDIENYGKVETPSDSLSVSFTIQGINGVAKVPVEANVMEYVDGIEFKAAVYPPVNIIPNGEEIFVYPEYSHSRKKVYTSKMEEYMYTERLAGSCNIWFEYGQGKELWGDDVAVTTGGAAQRFNFPINSGTTARDVTITVEAFTIGPQDVYRQYPDVVFTLKQQPVKYTISWEMDGFNSSTQVSQSPDAYIPIPYSIYHKRDLIFFIKEIEDCDIDIKQNGVSRQYNVEWDDDNPEMIKVTVSQVQGNIAIRLFAQSIGPAPTYKYRILQENCIQCSSCQVACKYGAVDVDEEDNYSIDPEVCVGCGDCQNACPVNVIERYIP